jgi:hypothetical protein
MAKRAAPARDWPPPDWPPPNWPPPDWPPRPRVRQRRRAPVAQIVAKDRRHRRQARALGAAGFLFAAALPAILFHRVIVDIAHEFRLDLRYLVEWAPWLLLVAGLAFLLPVAYSSGLNPDSRFFPRFRRAYAGWGITLYLLGIALATQVAQLYELHH